MFDEHQTVNIVVTMTHRERCLPTSLVHRMFARMAPAQPEEPKLHSGSTRHHVELLHLAEITLTHHGSKMAFYQCCG